MLVFFDEGLVQLLDKRLRRAQTDPPFVGRCFEVIKIDIHLRLGLGQLKEPEFCKFTFLHRKIFLLLVQVFLGISIMQLDFSDLF